MKPIGKKTLFVGSIVLGIALVLGNAVIARVRAPSPVLTHPLTDKIDIAEQVQLDAIPLLRRAGYTNIIDLRPDGEAADQPPSAQVETAVLANRMSFSYVPVVHGDIPANTVLALEHAITKQGGRTLLYCRSGRRAARTWSLVEASRSGGMDAAAILAAVKRSGQSADDLNPAIQARIAARKAAP